jgi:hypothetical protein
MKDKIALLLGPGNKHNIFNYDLSVDTYRTLGSYYHKLIMCHLLLYLHVRTAWPIDNLTINQGCSDYVSVHLHIHAYMSVRLGVSALLNGSSPRWESSTVEPSHVAWITYFSCALTARVCISVQHALYNSVFCNFWKRLIIAILQIQILHYSTFCHFLQR